MRIILLSITVVLFLAVAILAVVGGLNQRAIVETEDPVQMRLKDQPSDNQIYEGRIKDVRPAWGVLILTVGKGGQMKTVTSFHLVSVALSAKAILR